MSREKTKQRGSAKRQAILDGAREVFGRDGYSRASIDAIAKTSEVSTRTIYNHFKDKDELFGAVILESAEQVRDAQLNDLERHLGKIVDLESDLIALGLDFTALMPRFSAHFALVRQIQAEVGHIPVDLLRAWQETGPHRVQREFARRLADLGDRGLLEIEDARRAALHFIALVSTEIQGRSYYGALPVDDAEREEIVTAGVRTFLRAYGSR